MTEREIAALSAPFTSAELLAADVGGTVADAGVVDPDCTDDDCPFEHEEV